MFCSSCKQDKPVPAFYASVKSRCIDCHKKAMKRRALTNPDVQAYERARAKTPKRKAHIREVSRRWRERHPEAYRAQTAVGNAIRDGKIKKEPCAICGAPDVHAHHRNYSKPLDVTWLCPKCHQRLHAAFPDLGGHAPPSSDRNDLGPGLELMTEGRHD
jgi:ribosomal protein S27AE